MSPTYFHFFLHHSNLHDFNNFVTYIRNSEFRKFRIVNTAVFTATGYRSAQITYLLLFSKCLYILRYRYNHWNLRPLCSHSLDTALCLMYFNFKKKWCPCCRSNRHKESWKERHPEAYKRMSETYLAIIKSHCNTSDCSLLT